MKEPCKFKVGDKVLVNGWTSEGALGVVSGIDWIHHARTRSWCWGVYIEWEAGHRSPLTLNPIPEGYVRFRETTTEGDQIVST